MVPSPAELKRFSLYEKKSVTPSWIYLKKTLKRFKKCVFSSGPRQALLCFCCQNFEVTHIFSFIETVKLKQLRQHFGRQGLKSERCFDFLCRF